jgi:hypothetical protein
MDSPRSDTALPDTTGEKHVYVNEKAHSSDDHVDSLQFVPDGIHDGLEFPTEEERRTLRRVADKIPWNAYRALFPCFSFTRCSYLPSSHRRH